MQRLQKTLTDYLVIAITPALIMSLIGSLTFFLITVFYDGPFEGRLHFICALFIMATVLIGRISMEEGTEHAVMYSIPLGLAAMLAVTNLVEIQSESLREVSGLINIGLLAIIWWSAHKLTWDCTWINEHVNAGGEGLLGNLGMDDTHQELDPDNPQETLSYQPGVEEPPRNWWQRLTQQRGRAHAPGLWVIYFSLAAWPLFGFGQWFLRDRDASTQRYAFLLLTVYVVSGLCLLLTTSFLGLRRYLRQRKVTMPLEMAATWLGAGFALIALMLLFCLLLPRPGKPSVLSQLSQIWQSSDDLESSQQGVGKDGIDGKNPGTGQDPSLEGSGDGPQSKEGSEGSPEAGEEDGDTGQASSEEGSKAGGSSGPSKQPGDGKQTGKQEAGQSSSKDSGQQGSEPDQSSPDPGNNPSQPEDTADSTNPDSPPPDTTPPPSSSWLPKHLAEQLPLILKLILYAILLLAGCYLLFRYRRELIASIKKFIAELRSFWRWLWGQREASDQPSAPMPSAEAPRVYRPFASYRNPFSARASDQWTVEQLVCYSFDALEAWAREHGRARQEHQTPNEFARMLGTGGNPLTPSVRRIGRLYSQAAYAPGQLSRSCLEDVREFWQALSNAVPPSSTGSVPGEDSTAT